MENQNVNDSNEEKLSPVAKNELLSSVAIELITSNDPDVTKETIVLRRLKFLSENVYNISWYRILETIRQGQCYLDNEAHRFFNKITHNNEEIFDKISTKDFVKTSDLVRIASAFSSSFENDIDICSFFAVDGFSGFHDLKLYVIHFKCTENYKIQHIHNVRKLYEIFNLNAKEVHRVISLAFQYLVNGNLENEQAVIWYCENMGKELKAIKDWKTKDMNEDAKKKKKEEKMIKKRKAVEEVNN